MKLFNLQVEELKHIKTNLNKIQKRINEIESKMENEGVNGYYSVNDEILEYSLQVYVSLRTLSNLKKYTGEEDE